MQFWDIPKEQEGSRGFVPVPGTESRSAGLPEPDCDDLRGGRRWGWAAESSLMLHSTR